MNLMPKNGGFSWHRAPASVLLERDGIVVLADADAPNWIATDARGARILSYLDGRTTIDGAAARYASEFGLETIKAWQHVDSFIREAARHGFASLEPFAREPYAGRSRHLTP